MNLAETYEILTKFPSTYFLWRGGEIEVGSPQIDERGYTHIIYPGSFNPIHDGHRESLQAATINQHGWGLYEISIGHKHKPFIDLPDLELRLSKFHKHETVILTNCPRYMDKDILFQDWDRMFLMGDDVLARLLEDEGYENVSRLVRLAVSPRTDIALRYERLNNVILLDKPKNTHLSSTQLRTDKIV